MVDALTLHELDAGYGDSHVLHRVSLAVPQGRTLALLGRNGAGKTTCMGAIMGFVRVRGGHASAFGKMLRAGSPEHVVRQGVGIVPQGRRIFPSLTVRENLVVAARKVSGGAWTAERVFQTFPRLRERVSQLAGSMSGGEQQMLAIGRALMGAPRLLLLDEPSMGLAPLFVEEIFAIIAALKADGTTILLVEQNASAALDVADFAYVLENGRIVLSGPASEVANNPAVAAAYLGG